MDKQHQESLFYCISEVSELLNISQKTVRRHIASGKLKSVKIGGLYRVYKNSLDEFINTEGEEQYHRDLFGNKL